MIGMKEKSFCCVDEFMEDLFNTYDYIEKYECISVYAHADVISEIFRELTRTYYKGELFEFGIINFDGGGYDYDEEYLLTINGDQTVWIERALNKDKVIRGDAFINYVHADCNSKILIKLEDWEQRVIVFDYDECE